MLCSNQCKIKETHNRDAEGGYILILLLIVLVFLIIGGVAAIVTYGIAVFAPVVIGWIFIGIIASFVRSSPDGKGISTIILVLGGLVTIAYFAGNGWRHALICGHNAMVGSVSNDHNTRAMICGDQTYFNVPNGMSCEEYANSTAAAKAADKPTPEITQEVARRREKGLYDDDYRGYKYCDNYNIMYLLSAAKQMRRAGDYKSALPSFEQAKNCTRNDRFRDWIEGYILECKIKLGMDKLSISVKDINTPCYPTEETTFANKGNQLKEAGDCEMALRFFEEAYECTQKKDHKELIHQQMMLCRKTLGMPDNPTPRPKIHNLPPAAIQSMVYGGREWARGHCDLAISFYQRVKELITDQEILNHCDKMIQNCKYYQSIFGS